MDQSTALAEILPEIQRAAAKVGREWAAVTTAEDIEQEISLHLLEKHSATKIAAFDAPARRELLTRIGTQIASQERVDYDYFTGNYRYGVTEVRELLEKGGLHEARVKNRSERLDLDEGGALLRKRNPRYANLIGSRYLNDEPAESPADQKATERAVDALTDCMNQVFKNRGRSYLAGPGSRSAVSNARAAVLTSNQYGGDGAYSLDRTAGATGEF